LFSLNVTKEVLIELAIPICIGEEKKAGYPDCNEATCPYMCNALIHEESVDVLRILEKMDLQPNITCYFLLPQHCPSPSFNPNPTSFIPIRTNLSDHTNEVGPQRWPSLWALTDGIGTFVHLSDIHVDLEYKNGTVTDCHLPVCCHDGIGTAGLWGDYACDTPLLLLDSLMDAIAELSPNFIVYTGDDPDHAIYNQTREKNLRNIRIVSERLNERFPSLPIFHAIGNHESFPVNMFGGPGSDSWLLDTLSAEWTPLLSPSSLLTLRYGGYYTERFNPRLRIIALNTNLFVEENYWLFANFTDIAFQLNWLEFILKQAVTLQEKAVIIGHASCQAWYPLFCTAFDNILKQYSDVILYLLFGHTHTTSYVLHYDANDENPLYVAFLAGSITMINGINPTFRLNTYDIASSQLTDYTQFWFDMAVQNNSNNWLSHHYQASSRYQLDNMSAVSFNELAIRIQANITTYNNCVDDYVRSSGIWKNGKPTAKELYCEFTSTTDQQRSQCNNN